MVEQRRPGMHGTALLTPSLPLVWQLNALRVEDPDAAAPELAAEAEVLLAGLGHRKVLVHDEVRGAALAPGFSRLGWHVSRLLVLALRRPPERSAACGRGRGGRQLQPARPRSSPSVASSPSAARPRRCASSGRWTSACARDRGRSLLRRSPKRPASACRLYVDGSLAQIDEVGTVGVAPRAGPRERCRARRRSTPPRPTAASSVFLLTDADDWPRHWYRRLGFDDLGGQSTSSSSCRSGSCGHNRRLDGTASLHGPGRAHRRGAHPRLHERGGAARTRETGEVWFW